MSCLFYGHDAPSETASVAEVGILNMAGAMPSSAGPAIASPITTYRQVSKIKWLDVHVAKPWVLTADVVRRGRRVCVCVLFSQ